MKAVVTGATGAIGMALVSELVNNGIDVLVLCRPGSDRNNRIKGIPGITVLECDLCNLSEFRPNIEKNYDYFFHLAWGGTTGSARNDMFLQNNNVKYTLDAVDLADRMGCRVFIGAGSQAEFGRVQGLLSDSVPTNPENGYGIAKLCARNMSRIMCAQRGMRHVWACVLSVYGPYDGENSITVSSIRKMLSGEEADFTPGEQMWDFIYSADAARAFLAMAERGVDGAVYCVGSGKVQMLKEYIKTMRDAVDPAISLEFGKRPYAENQVMYLGADITKLTEDTGFKPKYSYEEGIRKTVEWVRADMKLLLQKG